MPCHQRARRLGGECRAAGRSGRSPRVVPPLSGGGPSGVSPDPAAGRQGPTLPSATVPAWKRSLDILCVVMSLPFVLPLMALLGLWIKLVSRGSALVRQERIGRNGKPFVLYKLRSMEMDCSADRHAAYFRGLVEADRPMLKMDFGCDPRLITGGRLMRATGLDELPQLFNVLRGEMSLVGPRPCLPGEFGFYSLKQRERFHALPGLTGLWQVSGKNRATFREMNAMDIHYVRHASPGLDLWIMLRTPAAILRQMMLAWHQRPLASRRLAVLESGADIGHATPSPRHQQLL